MKAALLCAVGLLAVGTASAAVPTSNAQSPNAAFVATGKGSAFCWVSLGSNYYESQQYTFVETSSGQRTFHCHAKLVTGTSLATRVEFDDLAWTVLGRPMTCDFTFYKKLAHWTCKEA